MHNQLQIIYCKFTSENVQLKTWFEQKNYSTIWKNSICNIPNLQFDNMNCSCFEKKKINI